MAVQRRNLMGRLISAGATVIAASSLFLFASFFAVWISILWSAIMILAMREGIKSAPKENRKRTNCWLGTLMVYGMLGLLNFAPAIVIGYLHGLIAAVASAWLILVTIVACDRGLNDWLGPVASLYADEPSRI